MSLRDVIETAIRARVEAVAPALLGDAWGGRRVAVIVERLGFADGRIEGRVVAELYADTMDALPTEAVALALLPPMAAGGALRLLLTLTEIRESLADGMAVLQAVFAARGGIDPAALPDELRAETILASWAPWIGAAYESHYKPVAADPADPAASLEEMLP